MIDLSIIIPALNEEKRIGKTLSELSAFLKNDPLLKEMSLEILVVSADGVDKTHSVAVRYAKNLPNFKLLKPGKVVGKGRDVQYGMLRAKGKYILFMDADLATPLHHIPIFYKNAQTGNDIVIATRNLKKHHTHLPRRTLSLAGNAAFKLLGGVWIEDSQCGFKLFTKKAAKMCFEKQTIMRWGFDMELLTIAKINGLKIEQLRINDWASIPGGIFDSGKIATNAIESLHDLSVIARNRILGKYTENS